MYPQTRLRRLRKRTIAPLVTETHLRKDEFCLPLFFDETTDTRIPIASMPGQFRYPLSEAGTLASTLVNEGVKSVLVFGIPKDKDECASSAFDDNGVVQKAVAAMKTAEPSLVVITDVCACEYTSHGHCGILHETSDGQDLDNDASLVLMQRIAVSHAKAGADMVAPSCMLDGMVSAIREALDRSGFSEIPIMSYSTKFASCLYGPFREAADSGFAFGDRTTYQMNPANAREAFRESSLDAKEGADILMVKPATYYLDIISSVKTLGLPVAAYHVSGEYSMIKAAAAAGYLDEKRTVMEAMIALNRAGANIIITYYTRDILRWLHNE